MAGPYISGHLTIWMPDVSGTMRSITFLSGAEQRSAWAAAWLNMVGLDVEQYRVYNGHYPHDTDEFPGRAGTFEYVTNVVNSIRSA